MIFEVLRDSESELCFETTHRARRGRGVLYALAPWLAYLFVLSTLFALSLGGRIAWKWTQVAAVVGALAAAAFTPVGYALGHRQLDRVEATREFIRIGRRRSLGSPRVTSLAVGELSRLGIDPNVRSLGVDLLLVAVHRDGRRLAVAEGEPHGGQLRQLALRAAQVTGLPLEAPRFAPADSTSIAGPARSQPKQ